MTTCRRRCGGAVVTLTGDISRSTSIKKVVDNPVAEPVTAIDST